MANRQVANSAWLAELSKIAANRVTTYNSTSTTIPAIAKICLEVIFVFLFCVSLSCDICIPFVITIHNHKRVEESGLLVCPRDCETIRVIRDLPKSRRCRHCVLRELPVSSSIPLQYDSGRCPVLSDEYRFPG